MPNVRGKKWVMYNTGAHRVDKSDSVFTFTYEWGWLISESKTEVLLLLDGERETRKYLRDYSLPSNWAFSRHLTYPNKGSSNPINGQDKICICLRWWS